MRYSLPAGGIVPNDAPETVVSKLPLGGDHPMHPFIIDATGSMYVDVATATNSCQPQNRQPKIPGANPCTELETRGGVWRYDANKTNQVFSPAERFATGIRNAEGFAIDSAAAYSCRNTGETSCIRIGLNFTKRTKRQRCLLKR